MKMCATVIGACFVLSACGGVPSGSLDADEKETFDRSAEGQAALQNAINLADSAFDFDPTIDPTKSAAENAAAVQMHVQTQGQSSSCGTASLQASLVTVSFASMCTLPNGVAVSGTFTVAVSKTGNTVTLALTFSNLTVNGTDLSGTATFATTTGSTFTVAAQLTSKGNSVSAMLTVTGTSNAVSIDGTTTVTKSGAGTNLTFNNVGWKKGDCYPSSGTLKVGRAALSQTVTFTTTTPSTGKVTVSTGRVTTSATLPAYGSCPKVA